MRWFGRNSHLLMLLVLASALSLAAQDTPASSGQTQNQSEDQSPGQSQSQNPGQSQGQDQSQNAESETAAAAPSEAKAPVPLPLSIDAGSLEFSPELAHTNYLTAGVSTGATYDSNLLSSVTPVGGFTYNIMPNISLNMSRPRLLWTLSYAGGFTVNQRYSAYNQSSHNAGIDLRYRLTQHVNLRLSDSFVRSNNFLDQLQGNTSVGGAGVVQAPNQAVITPMAPNTNNLGAAEITYQFSADDMVGASGTFYTSRFGTPPAGSAPLLDTTTEEADGFYSHRFTVRNWSGLAYKFQRLTFSPATLDVDTHSFLAFHTIYLQPRMELAFFAGAEYTDLNGTILTTMVALPSVSVTSTPDSHQSWGGTGGISYSWTGQRVSVRASGARKVTDGGGLLSAVTTTTASGAVRRQLTRNSNLEFGAIYGDSKALEPAASTFSAIKSVSGSVLWEQRFARSFTASLGFARDYQQQILLTPATLDINHSRGWVTFAYEFSRPLGR